jgi:hypothetical protein
MRRSEPVEAGHETKIRTVFQLLEENLLPEERDRASPAYRLGWYDSLLANRFGGADLENFRRFVDDMTERALKLSYRTEAIFPSDSATGLNAERIDLRILRARSLCESLSWPSN